MSFTNKKNIVWFGMMMLPAFILGGCTTSSTENKPDELHVTVPKPQVRRDYRDIKKSGVLRMITRYSSNTYFLHQGIAYGFEYELLKRFAEAHGLTLDVIVVQQNQNPYDMLNSGRGDVIAANYTITPTRLKYVDFTHPYNIVNQVIVFSDELDNPPKSLEETVKRHIPLTIRQNSSYYQQLLKMKSKGQSFDINLVANDKDTESLLFDVSRGEYAATVADDNIFQASNNYMGGLVRGPVIAQGDSIGWATRKNAPNLKRKMNKFIAKNFRVRGNGKPPKRSAFLNILLRRYFSRGPQIAGYYHSESPAGLSGVISPYDEVFKKVAASTGIDWLMLASIAAEETQFNPKAKSWTGAVGLMQVLPRYSEVDSVQLLYDAETNIREGARILSQHLRHYSYMDSSARWHFALAAYNAGQGHIADARRLVIDSNKNPNKWQPTANALIKLMDHTYYRHARHGFCRGIETVNYVQDVMNRYKTYQSIVAIANTTNEKSWPGVLGLFN